MKLAIAILTVVVQMIVAYVLGFVVALATGVGNGWDLVVIPVGNAIGVWGVGWVMARLADVRPRPGGIAFILTALGGALGVVAILLTPATGFAQLVYPLLGALIGYYATPFFSSKSQD